MKRKQEEMMTMEVDKSGTNNKNTKVTKASKKRKAASNAKNVNKKRKVEKSDENKESVSTSSLENKITKSRWTNKTRVLVFASRGVSFLQRHLMADLRSIMPHSKPDTKMEKSHGLFVINEICEMKNCNKCIFFEGKKKSDLYMWVANVPAGPSVKFLVENIYTMSELHLTGNCLKGSRSLLSFDKQFEASPHLILLKELFTQVFGVPNYHPKSKPFIDHVITFTVIKNKIWVRNFQIVEENAELVEIGPRFALNLIKIFKGSFSGETLYENPEFVTPNTVRSMLKKEKGHKYEDRILSKAIKETRKPEYSVLDDEVNHALEDD